jgi:subfamily B ATP-binding cassette protein MsbA
MTTGEFASYISAVVLLMAPTKGLAKMNEILQTALAAAQSVFGLIDAAAELDTGTRRLERAAGRVEYRGVGFHYPAAELPALTDVSFAIEPGQTVALVGTSGSGKTTIANLLPRFYRVTGGEIRIDGVDVNDLMLANLRSHIAIVGQEATLFDDTIRNNIAYGAPADVDERRLEEAAASAYVFEFARRFPEGLNARVGERGTRLSGGQRQRVAIARALYKDAPILVLDEATSALDTESERYVQEAMQKLRENRTTLVIAHRLSTVEHADRIVVLARGRIVESGAHQELLARNGAYAALYRQQFADAEPVAGGA